MVRRVAIVSPGRSPCAAWLPLRSGTSRKPAWLDRSKWVCQRSCFGLVIPRLGGRGMLTLFALLEPIALAIHRQDVDVMREPVEQGAGEPFGADDIIMPP